MAAGREGRMKKLLIGAGVVFVVAAVVVYATALVDVVHAEDFNLQHMNEDRIRANRDPDRK